MIPLARRLLVPALLAVHLALLVLNAWDTPYTADEETYHLAGRALWQGSRWETIQERTQGPLPFYANQLLVGSGTPRAERFNSRLGMLPFALLLAVVAWRWSTDLWGRRGGVLTLALTAFSPTLLGYGPLLAVDTALAALALLTFWTLWRWLRRPGVAGLLGWGAALGATLATKSSAALLALAVVPILAVAGHRGAWLFPWPARGGRAARGAATGLALLVGAFTALLVLHLAYRFAVPCWSPAHLPALESDLVRRLAEAPLVGGALRALPLPWVLGVDFQAAAAGSFRGTFLDYAGGHPAYYLVTLAVKLPLATLALLLLGCAALRRRSVRAGLAAAPGGRPGTAESLLTLWLPGLVLLAYTSLASAMQLGIRYVLPLLPVAHIQAGAWLAGAPSLRDRLLAPLLVAGVAAAALFTWPHHLGYFNLAGGGPAGGWRLFADSNCDWEQERARGGETLTRRHPGIRLLGRYDGPRFGTLGAYTVYLKRPDPERPGRTWHWLDRFEPVGGYGAAWRVFQVGPADFRAAAARGDARALRDLATAHIERDELDRARAAAPAGSPQAELLELLAAGKRGAPTPVQRRRALELLVRLGLADRAVVLARRLPGGSPTETFMLLSAAGRLEAALRVLEAERARRPLTHGETLLLAGALYHLGLPAEALQVMQEKGAPPAGPLRARWEAFKAEVEKAQAAHRKLRQLGQRR